MGKVRRYKKKLAKAASGTNDSNECDEQSLQTDYLELADGLLNQKKYDDNLSVCSIMKSVKSSGGGESLQFKKDVKRYLKHAVLLKRIEKTQKSISKQKKKSHEDDIGNGYDDDIDSESEVGTRNQKVLNWPTGNTHNREHSNLPKKHRKGFQKKQNAQLAKDLVLFSKKIKRQLKNQTQNVIKIQ